MTTKWWRITVHVCGSVLFLLMPVFFSPDFNSTLDFLHAPGFYRDFMRYFLLLLFFYFNFYILIPALLSRQHYLFFVLAQLLCFSAIFLITELVIPHPEFPRPLPPPHLHPHGFINLFELNHHIFHFLVVLLFSVMLRVTIHLRRVEREKLKAELSYLKAQINPHFLFNTLNSIYSLAITKSEETAEAVVKLSGMMRYVLNDASSDFVSLEKEIDYITNYIELQKLRLDESVKLHFECTGNIISKRIAPLVLIPFIENCFKYGVNPEEDSAISIQIEVKGDELSMQATNNKVKTVHSLNDKHSLGIENTRHRLQLLYPSKHLLTISDTEKQFAVSLTLSLQ